MQLTVTLFAIDKTALFLNFTVSSHEKIMQSCKFNIAY